MRFVYTEEQITWLRAHYQRLSVRELTPAFNRKFDLTKSEANIRSALKNRGITCGSKKGRRKGRLNSWTKEQAAWVKKAYKRMTHDDMPKPFFKKFGVVKEPQQFRALIHNQGYVSGRVCTFKKGHVPVNKGTKGLTGANAGSFKKGMSPFNEVPMWTERVDKEGFILIKVPEENTHSDTGYVGRFVFKHRHIWEKTRGKIPEGMALVFMDGNRANCELSNLELVKRSELLYLNRHFSNLPPALRQTAIETAKVAVKIQDVVKQQ